VANPHVLAEFRSNDLAAAAQAATASPLGHLPSCCQGKLIGAIGRQTNDGEQEIERELTSPADALRVALMMLARRGRLEIGDVLMVVAPN
jgi:hypothetical protein